MARQATAQIGDDFPTDLEVEVVERRDAPGTWAVEAIDHGSEGEIYLAVFAGPDAQGRAREYAAMKYHVQV